MSLKRGDLVMVISGGHKTKRPNKGKVGKILRFVGSDRVVVEGVNMVTRHQRQAGPNQPAGKIQKEAALHVSNVMFYAEKLKRPVRIKHQTLADGRRVRGFVNPETKQFEEIASEKK
ncbi:MAG: 50S ribosomal protein L24 [Proteobacteria bacterium]|nr:50S ribosomal protein L24 [Pseudomonadota bacterium]